MEVNHEVMRLVVQAKNRNTFFIYCIDGRRGESLGNVIYAFALGKAIVIGRNESIHFNSPFVSGSSFLPSLRIYYIIFQNEMQVLLLDV